MADGTPDFTDLLAAFDDAPAVNPQQNSIGVVGSNFQGGQLQFANIPNQLQVNALYEQNQGLFAPVNQALPPQGQLRQISATSQDGGLQNQSYQQPVNQNTLQTNMAQASTVEEPAFSGGSLGSMFLSSVEQALSGEGTEPYVMKIAPPVAQARAVQRRPRQRSKQNNASTRTAPQQTVQNMANVNANSSVQLSPFGNVVQTPAQVGGIQNAMPLDSAGPKMTQVSSPPFVLPADIQIATGMGQQKVMVQSPFMHPTQMGRQQTSGPPSNPPRPLSAASSTSDHLSRPGSVPQPSPSCGSSHSGDPATPLTPQSYNASVPQNYNAATPQPRSVTPQSTGLLQQRAGSFSDVSRQMTSKPNSASSNQLASNDSSGSSMPSPMKSQSTTDYPLSDLPTPVKQLLTTNQGMYQDINTGTGFQDMPGMVVNSTSHTTQPWYGGNTASSGLGQIQNNNNSVTLPSNTQSKVSNYMAAGSQLGVGYGQINALGMTSLPLATNYYSRNESNSGGTGSLTQKQSKLLEQFASSFGSKMKNKNSTPSQQPLSSQGTAPGTNTTSGYVPPAMTTQVGSSVARHSVSESNMMDIMNKASDTGAATMKGLFDSHATQYEAISPVSDYAMSPISKSSLTDDSLFGQTKVSTEQSSIDSAQDDTLTDPVLMYIKQDSVPQVANTTNFNSSHVASFSQGPSDYYSSSFQGSGGENQESGGKTNNSAESALGIDTRGSSGTYFTGGLSNMLSFPQSNYGSGGDWPPMPVVSKSHNVQGGIGSQLSSSSAKITATEPHLTHKSKEKKSPLTNSNSPQGKQSAFGVNRRKSSAEKSKFSSVTQPIKSNSLDSDFGFDSDDNTEPTIRLSKPAKTTKSNNKQTSQQLYRVETAVTSPKHRMVNPYIPDTMKDTLETMKQLQKQNQLLQRMQQYQLEKAARSGGTMPNITMSQFPGRSTVTSSTPRLITPKVPIPSSQQQQYQTSRREIKVLPAQHLSPSKGQKRRSVDLTVAPRSSSQLPVVPPNQKVSVQPPVMISTSQSASQPYQTQERLPYHFPPSFENRMLPIDIEATAPRTIQSQTKVPTTSHVAGPPLQTSQPHGILPVQPKLPITTPSTLPTGHFTQSYLSQAYKTTSTSAQAKVVGPLPNYVSSLPAVKPADFMATPPDTTSANRKAPSLPAPAVATTASPATVSISQTMMPFPYPDVTLSQTIHPHFFQGTPMPPFSMSARPAHFSTTTKSDIVTKNTSTIATSHLDLDWLPAEPEPTPKTNATPQLSLPTTKIAIPSTSSPVTTFATSGIPKPSFYPAKTENILPQKDEPRNMAVHPLLTQTKATTLQTPTAKMTAVVSETPAVHHETKQHHYAKKHRILEGSYPNSSEPHKYRQSASNHLSAANHTNGIPAHSVLDKQRRYSKEHSSAKSKKLQHVATDGKSPQVSKPIEALTAAKTSSQSGAKPDEITNTSAPNMLNVERSKAERRPSAPKAGVLFEKDDQAGSMLSLFNSLLQEASDASLNSTLKTADDKEKSDRSAAVNGAASASTKAETTAAKPVSAKPVTAKPVSAKPVSAKPVSTSSQAIPSTSVVTSLKSDTPVLIQKTIVKKRPAATVPFKRRPYPPTIDDVTPANVPPTPAVVLPTVVTPVSASISAPASCTPILVPTKSAPKQVVTTTIRAAIPATIASTTKSLPPPKNLIPPAVSVAMSPSIQNKMKITAPTVKVPATESSEKKSPIKSVGLPKLRITAFRSLGGQVIHQASMIGAQNAEFDQGATHHHKHKKKKKKRKKKRVSSSDYDSSVSSLTSMSSFEPAKAIPNDVPAVSEKEVVPDVITERAEGNKIITSSPKQAPKRKRANASTVSKELEKKKPVPAKRAKVAKESAKKKCDAKSKEPVARYQPKSAYNVSSSAPGTTPSPKVVVSLPSNFHRAPGKLPLYLNSSESKSNTVPTIQLVARNTKLLENIAVDNSNKQNPSKVVSVKIASSPQNKSIPTQIITNSSLQYIVSSNKNQQRIILPNMSTSLPMSIVSPIMSKTTIATSFIPVSVGALVTSPVVNKSRLLSVPISISDSTSTPVRLVGAKLVEPAKSSFATPSPHTAKSLSSPKTVVIPSAKAIFSSPTTTKSRAATMTVSVLQTNPATVSTVGSKVVTPLGSPPPNLFQSTFSKLISGQNPVAKYTPAAPPAHLSLDLEGHSHHQCLECKDSFMFQSSLVDHYERRSIMIKVRCVQCDESLLFLNKCKLLKHARQHSDKGNGMQFNNAHISPLPLSMCKPRSKESFLNETAASLAEKRRSTTSSEDDLLSSSIGSSILVCADCSFLASGAEAMEEHFQQQATPVSPDTPGTSTSAASRSSNFTCDMCNLTLFNQCSFMAHMRMHKRIAPHTCPECGQNFDYDGKDMDFNLHLSIQCFHLSRMSCYKCRLCCSIFKNADLLRRHLEVRHLQTFYKCRDCPMAFKTQENINSHQRTAHGVIVATKMIHKCPLCDTVFTDNSPTQQIFLLQKHFEAHINHPSINITAYKCLFCNNIYERKSLLREHLKSVHDVTSSADTSGSRDLTKEMHNAKLLMSIEKKKKSVTGATAKKVAKKRSLNDASVGKEIPAKVQRTSSSGSKSAGDANSLIASGILGGGEGSSKKGGMGNAAATKHARQPVKLRLKGMTSNSAINLTSAKQTSARADDAGAAGSHVTTGGNADGRYESVTTEDGRKIFRCKECKKELPSQNACLSHMRIKHDGIRTLYCCPHCPVDVIKFAKRISLKKHLKKVHNITEVRKQDIRMIYAHVPPVPEGQRFDPSTVSLDKDGKIVPQMNESSPGHKQVRKKVTGPGRKNSDRVARGAMRQARQRSMVRIPSIHVSSSEDEPVSHADSEDVAKSGEEDDDFTKLHFPDVYKCAKCDYESSDRLEFQVHIVEHKEEAEVDGSFSCIQQCTECGLCFASCASLAKHLFIKHKIKRKRLLERYDQQLKAERKAAGSLPKSLLDENGSASSASGGSSGGKKHRCSVCYRRFEDDSLLRTHMRTHGLAFVKSKAES